MDVKIFLIFRVITHKLGQESQTSGVRTDEVKVVNTKYDLILQVIVYPQTICVSHDSDFLNALPDIK